MKILLFGAMALAPFIVASQNVKPQVNVTVSEGTSMSVSVSPDGQTLAIDLQGSIWTLPAKGGAAKRITDFYNDARQPMWSPDGKWITFFGYRDGGYDLWAIAPDGTHQHKLTWGPFDDREPVYSHDGTKIAFSSDRGNPLGSDNNIWVLDLKTGELKQLTTDPAEDYMPSWSPNDREIAFASTRDDGHNVWAVDVATARERRVLTTAGRVDSPSWGPGGQIVYNLNIDRQSRLEVDGKPLTGNENAFAFRASWTTPADFYYVSDGKIRKRSVNGGEAQTIEFTATLAVTPTLYTHKREFDSTAPRQAVGIVRPVISPDGTRVAFAAVGDIYVMPVGGLPENITRDKYLDTDPAWSPDGTQLVYSSDKGGGFLQLWIRDMKTGRERQLTHLTTQPQGAAWSPDGKKIAFFAVDAMWRAANVSLVDVATGEVTRIHDSMFGPGTPAWSADSKTVAIAMIAPYSKRFREGTNQVLTMPAAGGSFKWYAPVPALSIDSRGECGPVWSPDGTKMAAIYEGVLAVWPVSPAGEPLGPPRRVTAESAHAPSWYGDSKRILYQALGNQLKSIDIETGEVKTIALDLKYTPSVSQGRIVIRATHLVDGNSTAARPNVDIVIEGNRIRSVAPHSANLNTAGATVVDATAPNLYVMPGLIEYHSHLQKDFGEAQGRAWLSFGITTVRSPGNTPYEAAEDREANAAGVRPGPRVYGSGWLFEWQRTYYKMGVAISSPAHFEMELQRARELDLDLLKSYVRLPDLQQKRMVEFAHANGIPVATHEIYPAAFVGVDSTEHTSGTSRRGYSPKIATLQRSYQDVIQLFGKSGRIFCPMISPLGANQLFEMEPSMRQDPRFALYPQWMRDQVAQPRPSQNALISSFFGDGSGSGKMVVDVMNAGGLVVAGTDTPNGFNLHGELEAYVMAGMTPYQALRAATVNPSKALGLDAGSIEAGKLADLVIVEGDPLENIANAHHVKRVVANGRLFDLKDLLEDTYAPKSSKTADAR
ncbi:MAG TPA: amidohydrolase family protein [Candidatus Acidoferrales bacterium]|nr:amidohydrolase family protein [Candidatus Acidoferrales bacterium]